MDNSIEDRILDSAERLMGRLGYQKMTMEDIARTADLGRRTIYLHFASKEEVALRTIDRIVDRLLDQLSQIARSSAAPEVKLRQMLVARVQVRIESVQDYYHSFHDLFAALRPAYLLRRERYFTAEAAVFAEVLVEGRDRGVFDLTDEHAAARLLLTATNALLPYSLSVRELGAREEIIAQVEGIATLFLTGLLHR